MKRAVFLDRDGVLIEEKHYLHRPEEVVVFPGAGAALRRLADRGYLLVVVTNQSGVGRGYYPLSDVHLVNERMRSDYRPFWVEFTQIYIAPEAPDQPSLGRKPSPHFLLEARSAYGIDLEQSFMIGDKLIDLECGWNAGVRRSILVRTGYGAKTEREAAPVIAARAGIVVDGLTAAAQAILDDASE